jgi:alpha-D-ribose 1-methylphosphonate 5-triphosphate synthase subunit PhnH
MEQLRLEGGFVDPVFGAQATFRALMNALANPGRLQSLAATLEAPAALGPELASVALTLCDHDTTVWLDPALAESEAVMAWLRFHTAAPIATDPGRAQIALVSSVDALPALERFAPGSQEYPDRSTTIALVVTALGAGPDLTLRGPGIMDHTHANPEGLPPDFLTQWAANRDLFPRGIDLLLVSGGAVLGLPRTTRITMEAH